MPPRHGKSELCSHYFPAWYLGRHPDHNIILASYESGLAALLGEKARDVLAEYGQEVFGVGMNRLRASRHDWRVAGNLSRGGGGGMRSVGITGGITGRGANLIIIDDPVKDALMANSETYRNRAWDWYATTARSRLEPGGIMIAIQTRWHQDDLIGRIRKQQTIGGEVWESITLPALADKNDALGRAPGEALWPWRFDEAALAGIRRGIPEHWWNALYQQRPTPPGGSLAKETWFRIIGDIPPEMPMQRVRFWDCAGSEEKAGSDPDWTVGALLARDGTTYYIEDIIRVRRSSGEVAKLIHQTAVLDGPDVAIREESEGGSSGPAVINSRAVMLAGFNYKGCKALGKPGGWTPMLTQAELGNIRMVSDWGKEKKWNGLFLAEVAAAPHGTHDDQLDAVSGAFVCLALEPQASLAAGAMYPLYY